MSLALVCHWMNDIDKQSLIYTMLNDNSFFSSEISTDFFLKFPSSGILDYVSLEGFSQSLNSVSISWDMYLGYLPLHCYFASNWLEKCTFSYFFYFCSFLCVYGWKLMTWTTTAHPSAMPQTLMTMHSLSQTTVGEWRPAQLNPGVLSSDCKYWKSNRWWTIILLYVQEIFYPILLYLSWQPICILSRFVLYVNGAKQITDVRINDGMWHHVCVTWTSADGAWIIYLDGILIDSGTGLANGTSIEGKWGRQ